MPVCVINQPAGLGDILWVQPIVDHMIGLGYEVVYPVNDLYYEMISRSIRKDGLRWVPETGEYPMKEFFFILDSENIKHDPSIRLLAGINEGKTRLDQTKNIKINDLVELMMMSGFNAIRESISSQFMQRIRPSATTTKVGEDLYLALQYSSIHLPLSPSMPSKYFLLDIPVTNWHTHINFERDKDREDRVFEVYGIDRDVDYTLTNITYGTPPNHITRDISTHTNQTDHPVVEMSYEKDSENGICLFDWIGVVEQAKEIHTIETSLCFLVDIFAQTPYIFMYGRIHEPPGRLTSLVYRNSNWTYFK